MVKGGEGGGAAQIGDHGDVVREAGAVEVHVVVGVKAEQPQFAGKSALGVGIVGTAWLLGLWPDGIFKAAAHAEDAVAV